MDYKYTIRVNVDIADESFTHIDYNLTDDIFAIAEKCDGAPSQCELKDAFLYAKDIAEFKITFMRHFFPAVTATAIKFAVDYTDRIKQIYDTIGYDEEMATRYTITVVTDLFDSSIMVKKMERLY